MNGTPSSITAGSIISGAYPFEQFHSLIDQALAATP